MPFLKIQQHTKVPFSGPAPCPFEILAGTLNWLCCSWIYNYLCNQCLSWLKLWVQMPCMVRCTKCTWYNIM